MSEPQLLAVDYSQGGATSQTLPTASLLYRYDTLPGLFIEGHSAPPHETPEHAPRQHTIAIQIAGTVQAERRLDGRKRQEQIQAGEICIVPAGAPHWIRTQGEQELLFLSIEPAFLNQLAYDSVGSDPVDLVPHFATEDPLMYHLGRSLVTALQTGSRLYAESLATALGAHLLEYYTTDGLLPPSALPTSPIQQSVDYIQAHLGDRLALAEIAAAVGLSKYHFCRAFKQEMGIAPWQYVMQQRLAVAKRLLKGSQSVTAVGQQLGFGTQSQFTHFFRKQVGVSPSQYRQEL